MCGLHSVKLCNHVCLRESLILKAFDKYATVTAPHISSVGFLFLSGSVACVVQYSTPRNATPCHAPSRPSPVLPGPSGLSSALPSPPAIHIQLLLTLIRTQSYFVFQPLQMSRMSASPWNKGRIELQRGGGNWGERGGHKYFATADSIDVLEAGF